MRIFCCLLAMFYGLEVFAMPTNEKAFMVKDDTHTLCAEGPYTTRHAPCSTFKIPLALMGYENGFLKSAQEPLLQYDPSYEVLLPKSFEMWRQDHTPQTWMQRSCVWYSQLMTQSLGIDVLQNTVARLHYGNENLQGNAGKNDGLTRAWLSSSLQISPEEQVDLLLKLVQEKAPFSEETQRKTKEILFLEILEGGWKLYGKTGMGHQVDESGARFQDAPIGWFVGWVEKEGAHVAFAHYEQKDSPSEDPTPLPQILKREAIRRVVEFLTPHTP